jgi:hypothetical protein
VKWRDEDCSCTACAKDICPCSLIQLVINVVDIAIHSQLQTTHSKTWVFRQSKWHEWHNRLKHLGEKICWYLAQAMSCITDPKRRKVQLNASPTFLQCLPSNPSSTSNHCLSSRKPNKSCNMWLKIVLKARYIWMFTSYISVITWITWFLKSTFSLSFLVLYSR